jgi:hypothetical protein
MDWIINDKLVHVLNQLPCHENISLCLIKPYTTNLYGQMEYGSIPLLILAQVGCQWSASHLGHSILGETALDISWIGDIRQASEPIWTHWHKKNPRPFWESNAGHPACTSVSWIVRCIKIIVHTLKMVIKLKHVQTFGFMVCTSVSRIIIVKFIVEKL